MSVKEYKLLNLLCERVGITTAAELDNFKQITKVHDN